MTDFYVQLSFVTFPNFQFIYNGIIMEEKWGFWCLKITRTVPKTCFKL